ncbi:MAG: hypothetical protein WB504_22145, partial [Pseudolabrys sp.]
MLQFIMDCRVKPGNDSGEATHGQHPFPHFLHRDPISENGRPVMAKAKRKAKATKAKTKKSKKKIAAKS